MKQYEPAQIRNMGLYGHQGSGKTTVAEAMCFLGKSTTRLCSVAEGNSNFDFEAEEIRRKSSMSTSIGYAEWGKTLINVIDNPGDTNFAADATMAVVASDIGVLVVSAVDGLQVGTEKAFRLLSESGIPCMVMMTKVDKERANYDRVLSQIREALGAGVVPLTIPMGEEAAFKGVVDLLNQEARTYPEGLIGKKGPIPADQGDRVKGAREALMERLAEQDDALIEKYFADGELSADDIRTAMTKGMKTGNVIPVFCCNAVAGHGVDVLMDMAADYGVCPLDRKNFKTVKGDVQTDVVPSATGPFLGYVFKTIIDVQAGKITMIRVISGSMPADGSFMNVDTGTRERYGQVFKMLGRKQEGIPTAVCGDIVSVVKLKETRSGQTLAADDSVGALMTHPLPGRCIGLSVRPKTHGDEDKMSAALQKLLEEDVGIAMSRSDEGNEIIINGLGQVHLEVAAEKLKRKYGVDIEMKPPRVPYRETIRGTVKNVEGKHKKQTGGRGQFGVCYIDMEPAQRGKGFEFVDAIFGGAIPRQFIPAVEKGLRDSMNKGVVAGYPVVDVKVTLTDGKYHDVDSDGRSFEMAGSKGFKAAFRAAKPVILEPIMALTIVIPDECLGDIMGDLSSRRGRIQGMEAQGHFQVVKGLAPMSEVLTYASDLRSMTSDRGTFTMEMVNYEELPANLAEKLMAEAQIEEDED